MLAYPVRLVPTREGTVRAVFQDVPQAVTEGRDEEDALYRADLAGRFSAGRSRSPGTFRSAARDRRRC
jgi:hypothetical protein